MRWLFGRYGRAAAGLALAAAACSSSSPAGAAQAIESYLQARAESDLEQMTLLSCPAWEAQARIEAASFEAMNARLEGVSCEAGGADGDFTLVNCQGQIVTTYQGETREWSVADHPYRALLDGGEWRMCGYGDQ